MSFGELRSTLQQTPSVAAFRRACALCDQSPNKAEVAEVWAPYAHDHLRSWGEEVRQPSVNGLLRWLHEAPDAALPYSASLADHMHLTHLFRDEMKVPHKRTQRPPADRLRELTERLPALLPHARILTLEDLAAGDQIALDRLIGALAGAPAARHLRHLRLYHLQSNHRQIILSEHAVSFLASSPHLADLRELDLCGQRPTAASVAALASSNLTGLRRLDLRACQLTGAQVAALAQSDVFGRLEEINLQDNPLGDEGVDVALGTPGAMPALRHLTLGTTRITAEGLRHVLECHTSRAQPLEELNVNENPLGLEGMRMLVSHPGAAGLRGLVAGGCEFNAEAIAMLCGSRQLSGLQRLFLWGNTLGDAGVEQLANSPLLAQLHDLHLDRVQMSERGFIRLISSPYAGGLTRLSVQRNELGLPAVRALVGSPAASQLETLSIGYNPIPWAEALERLSAEGALPRLRRLELDARWYEPAGLGLGARGAALLARSPLARQLESLSLDRQMLGDDGIELLLSGDGFPRLHTLSLHGAGCTERGLKLLCTERARQRLPSLRSLNISNGTSSATMERVRNNLDLQSIR
jgi:hypothetical protein